MSKLRSGSKWDSNPDSALRVRDSTAEVLRSTSGNVGVVLYLISVYHYTNPLSFCQYLISAYHYTKPLSFCQYLISVYHYTKPLSFLSFITLGMSAIRQTSPLRISSSHLCSQQSSSAGDGVVLSFQVHCVGLNCWISRDRRPIRFRHFCPLKNVSLDGHNATFNRNSTDVAEKINLWMATSQHRCTSVAE